MKRANAHILYSECEVDKMINYGIKKETIFIAHNTMLISNAEDGSLNDKYSLLFVGRAQKRKKVDLLLNAFAEIKAKIPKNITIDIIGEGDENKLLESLAN